MSVLFQTQMKRLLITSCCVFSPHILSPSLPLPFPPSPLPSLSPSLPLPFPPSPLPSPSPSLPLPLPSPCDMKYMLLYVYVICYACMYFAHALYYSLRECLSYNTPPPSHLLFPLLLLLLPSPLLLPPLLLLFLLLLLPISYEGLLVSSVLLLANALVNGPASSTQVRPEQKIKRTVLWF